MDKCPECNNYTLEYDFKYQRKKCYSNDCDYYEWYCPEKWLLEHNDLPLLLGEKRVIEGQCRRYDTRTYTKITRLDRVIDGLFISKCLDCECMPKDQKSKIIKAIVADGL